MACKRDLFKGSPQGFIVTWFLFHCVLLSYFITNNHFYYKQISSYFVVISKIYKASARNSANRSYYKKDRLHRTGSKHYRQVAWELVMYLWNLRFFFGGGNFMHVIVIFDCQFGIGKGCKDWKWTIFSPNVPWDSQKGYWVCNSRDSSKICTYS